jgi:hypothetical protein
MRGWIHLVEAVVRRVITLANWPSQGGEPPRRYQTTGIILSWEKPPASRSYQRANQDADRNS